MAGSLLGDPILLGYKGDYLSVEVEAPLDEVALGAENGIPPVPHPADNQPVERGSALWTLRESGCISDLHGYVSHVIPPV